MLDSDWGKLLLLLLVETAKVEFKLSPGMHWCKFSWRSGSHSYYSWGST